MSTPSGQVRAITTTVPPTPTTSYTPCFEKGEASSQGHMGIEGQGECNRWVEMGEGFRPVRVTRLGLGRQAAWEWREPTCGPYLLCLLQFPPIQINLTSILQAGNRL